MTEIETVDDLEGMLPSEILVVVRRERERADALVAELEGARREILAAQRREAEAYHLRSVAVERADDLASVARDLHWMARRYADGRRSYATSTFNLRTRALLGLGVPLNETGDGTIWARDGMGRAFDGLTDEEAAHGRPPDWWHDGADAREEMGRLTAENANLRAKNDVYGDLILGLAMADAEIRAACLRVTDDYNHGISQDCRLCGALVETDDDEHEPSCVLARPSDSRGAELLAAAREMAEETLALVAHFRRHAQHRCEIDREAEASASRYRALVGPAVEGDES